MVTLKAAPSDTAVEKTSDVQPSGPRVTIHAAAGLTRVSVEVARTPDERRQGLMYRESLQDNWGMVFLFERDEDQRFWMQNTLIELDMIFITSDMRVAGVVHRAVPKTTVQRGVGKPSRYVLEVVGGFAKKMGITAGDKVEFKEILTRDISPTH